MNEKELHILKKSNDAPGTSRGFLYQYLKTVEKWLEHYISQSEIEIYCETEDDIKLLDQKEKNIKFNQIKCYSNSFNINADEVKKAIYNFFVLYLKYGHLYHSTFVFKSNSSISRNDELLKQWAEDQNNILESKALNKCVTIVKEIIKELSNQQIEFQVKLINDKILRREKKIKNGVNVEQSSIEIKTFNKELYEILNLQSKICSIVDTEDIKHFIKRIRWSFEKRKPAEVIKITEEKIYNLIKRIGSIQAAPNLMAARLLTEVYKKSSEEDESKRCLDYNLVNTIIGESCIEMQLNVDEKFISYFDKVDKLEERVSTIEFEIDENRYLPFNNETFVEPKNYNELMSDLIYKKSIILTGGPGVGKTSVAEQIIYEIHKNNNIKRIIKICNVNDLKNELNKDGNCICFLEDPWGKYKLEEDGDDWKSELKYLLTKLRQGKYLIVTSRENILKEAMVDILPEINDKIKYIDVENYDYDRRKLILYNSIDSNVIWHKEFVSEYLEKILNTLTIPFSLVRLGGILKNYSDKKSVKIGNILRKSKIEFLREEFLEEISHKTDELKNGGIILWILYATKTSVNDDLIRNLSRGIRNIDNNLKFDLYKLTNWMSIAKWLNKRNDIYNVHPIVLDALEQHLNNNRLISADYFDIILEYYTSFDYSKALEIINHINRLNFKVPKQIEKSINNYLVKTIVEANDENFEVLFYQVAQHSTLNDPVTLITKWLKPDFPSANRVSFYHKSWKKPCWTTNQKETIRISEESYEISKKFIINIFPYIRGLSFDDGQELFNVFNEFDWDFSEELLNILNSDNYKFDKELDRILVGILSGKNKPYDMIIYFLLTEITILEEYYDNAYNEKFRMTEQAELDMSEINYIENITDDLSAYKSALQKVIKARCKEQGYLWIKSYSNVENIFRFLIELLEKSISTDDLKVLYSICPNKDKHNFLDKIRDFKRVEFVNDIKELLSSYNNITFSTIQSCINALWELCTIKEIIKIITEIYKIVEFYAFVDIVYAIWEKTNDNYLIDKFNFFSNVEKIIISNCYSFYSSYKDKNILKDESKLCSIDPTIINNLNNIIKNSQSEIITLAFNVLYFFNVENENLILDILTRRSTNIRGITYQTIAFRGTSSDLKLIVKYGLVDRDYKCRQYCMEFIAHSGSKEDILSILELSKDSSAMVREKCAYLIGKYVIEEGISDLFHLLKDKRNKNMNYDQPDFHVARVAAISLGMFANLQHKYINFIYELLDTSFTKDIVVVYEMLEVLMKYPIKETLEVFKKYLTSDWKYIGSSDNSYPLRYVSAWGILVTLIKEPKFLDDELIKLIESNVCTTDDRLSEPLLICMCIFYQKFSTILNEILLNKEIAQDKILIFYLCNLIEKLGYDDHVNKYVNIISKEPSYELIKFKEDGGEIDQTIWDNLCRTNIKLKEWITSINKSHNALNYLMRFLLSNEEKAIIGLKKDNFRKNEIPETMGIFSFYE